MKKKWDRSAMRFVSAKYVPRQGMLDVAFENGDHFLLDVESVLSKATNGAPVDWNKLRVGETGDVLEVPVHKAVIEIPWDKVRSIADPDFRAHLADAATERARRIGVCIRKMRLEASLTRPALAAKVGVPPEVVANIEAGKGEPSIALIEHFALALGKRLGDFAEEGGV
jgi:DNA-binding XRE family transcriptional regulator